MPQERPRVVIAGAGFGGLEAAKALRAAAADVIVIGPGGALELLVALVAAIPG